MFYISSENNGKFGVTDTRDNIEEFYTTRQLVDIYESKKADIYGVKYYNHDVRCTVLSINKVLSKERLKKLLADWKKVHNPWTGLPVEDYLACAKVGTIIEVDYEITSSESRRKSNGKTRIVKKSYDEWFYEDEDNTFSGKTDDSRFAAWCLEVACIYCKMLRLTIGN